MKPLLCEVNGRVTCATCALAGLDTCPAQPGGMSIVAAKLVNGRPLDYGQAVKLARDVLGPVDQSDMELVNLFRLRHPSPRR